MNKDILLHGGALDQMFELYPNVPKPWLDLSTGMNPWPYLPSELHSDTMSHLPTATQYFNCLEAMAKALNLPTEQLLLAPGSELLIRLLPTILIVNRVCVASRSFGDHANTWQRESCELLKLPDPLSQAHECDVVVICNPNNPDGRAWSRKSLLDARDTLLKRGATLVVDEAYADLEPENSLISEPSKDGLIILRSFGKFFGLGGVRLGAMSASTVLLDAMRERLGAWPVAGPTLEIGAAAYSDLEWQKDSRARLSKQREVMDSVLKKNAFPVVGGTDLYRFIRVTSAKRVWHELAVRGIYVRQFDWCKHSLRMGLPDSDVAMERLDLALKLISP